MVPKGKGPRVRTIVRVLSLYASFLERAKGDVDSSMLVLKRAIEVSFSFLRHLYNQNDDSLRQRTVGCSAPTPTSLRRKGVTSIWLMTFLRER